MSESHRDPFHCIHVFCEQYAKARSTGTDQVLPPVSVSGSLFCKAQVGGKNRQEYSEPRYWPGGPYLAPGKVHVTQEPVL